MAMEKAVRWAVLAVLLGVSLLSAEGAPGETVRTASSLSTSSSQGAATRARRSTAGAAGAEEGSDYHNDEADYGDEEGTGEEEEEASPAPPPVFLSAPLNFTLRPGDNVSLPCRVDSIRNFVQMWLNGSQTITIKDAVLGDNQRISRLPDMSLLILGVRPEDSGAYTCQISSEPLTKLVHYVRVPAPAKIISHSSKQIVVSGQQLSLNCKVWGSPQPNVKWTLQTRPVPDATFNEDGSVMTIKSVTKHHEGQYKCMADNGVGKPVETGIMVTVQNKPQVIITEKNVISGEGETVELSCTVLGQPKPQVKWFKDGEEVEVGSSRFEGSAVENTYKLRIKNLEKTDFGNYTCSAKNKYGSRQRNITLAGFPDIPKYLGSKVEDDKVILQWDIESSAPIRAHEMRYRKQESDEWISVSPPVKDADGNIYRVEVVLADIGSGDYEAVFHSQNEFGWGEESQPVHFQGREKPVHEDVSPSIEAKPAAETSKRGPDGNGGAAMMSLSSLAAALLSTLVFRTLFNYL